MEQKLQVTLLTIGSPTKVEASGLTRLLEKNFYAITLQWIKTESWIDHLDSCELILLLIDTPWNDVSGITANDLNRYYQILTNECSRRRKRVVHVLVNSSSSEFDYGDWKMTRRVQKMFIFHFLPDTSMEKLAHNLTTSKESVGFSSPGESFAWQLVSGFLCYVLPNLQAQIASTLMDEDGSLRVSVLRDHGVELTDPQRVLVLPRYFMLLREQVVCNQVSVDMTPQELFPGCRRIGKAPSQLCLEFDSPGYKKIIPAYLLELKEPIVHSKSENSYTHVMVFCAYAAPMFVMQKLEIANEDRISMLNDFKDELEAIVRHPSASQMLQTISADQGTQKSTEFKSDLLQLFEYSDEISLEADIVQQIRKYLTSIAEATSLTQELGQISLQPTDEFADDHLPLMSMAFAMAANSFVGFGMQLKNYLQSLINTKHELPFDLPYCFVLPRSGKYPDEKKLENLFNSAGVQSEQQQFQTASGRRYSYRVHNWKSRRIAFEIPPSVFNIRKQAEIGVGGVRNVDLRVHLDEFKSELDKFVTSGSCGSIDGCLKVVEWNDISGFRLDEGSTDPGAEFAVSLLDCILQAVA